MKIQGEYGKIFQRKEPVYQVKTKEKNISQKMDRFTKSLHQELSYQHYTKYGEVEEVKDRKVVGLTEEQFQAMLKGEWGEVETDGKNYWMVIDGILYAFKKIDNDEAEKKDTKQILLDTVEECLERVQENLDETFYKWTMKEDILYPNQGKNAIITLEDVLKKKEEEALDLYKKQREWR